MAKNIEYFRKRLSEQKEDQARLAGNLDNLKKERAALEEQIITAIDENRLDDVDKLTAKETDLENKIRAAEKIIARKAATATLDMSEIREASNTEMQKYQGKVTDLVNEAKKLHRTYFETLIKAGDMIQAANGVRSEYMQLVGADANADGFDSVHGNYFVPQLRIDEAEVVNSIKMGGSAQIYILNQ